MRSKMRVPCFRIKSVASGKILMKSENKKVTCSMIQVAGLDRDNPGRRCPSNRVSGLI